MKIDETLKSLEQTLLHAETARNEMISDLRNIQSDDPNIQRMQNDLPKLVEEMESSENPISVYLSYAKKMKQHV